MKRFWQFLIVMIFGLVLVGCNGSGSGTGTGTGTGGGNEGGGDTEEVSCATDSTQAKCSDPETWDWEYNRSGFDGKGMTIKLLHGAPEEVDPNATGFTGERQADKALQLFDIQEAYKITLSIEKFPDEAAWGRPEHQVRPNGTPHLGH